MFGRVRIVEKMLFTRELAVYLKSAVPLHEALVLLARHEKLSSFHTVIQEIALSVENGQSLSHTLSRFPDIFDRLYLSLVEVGEASGTLPESLEQVSFFLERSYTLRKKVQSIFLYPTMIISVALLMSAFITIYILPQLIRLFQSFQTELPWPTKVLLWLSTTLQMHGWKILLGGIVIVIGTRLLFTLPFFRTQWQLLLPRLPFVGGFLRQYYAASFFHDIGVLLRSGVTITQAMAIEKESHRNAAFRKVAANLEQSLEAGKSLWEIFERQYAPLFPSLVSKMVAAGERSGKLKESFFYLSNFFDEEVERSIKNFTVLLEPILLIIIGGVVAFVATAILSPIYALTGSLRR
ncbi:MAG: type II secretion system F family protein [Candidatus Moraniibacteriota bacterium]|nr:MAG: type II secretion system F family protein [Candidatus Moranbacteria bacterium]